MKRDATTETSTSPFSKSPSILEILPEESLFQILDWLNPYDILSCRKVCNYFREQLTGVIYFSCHDNWYNTRLPFPTITSTPTPISLSSCTLAQGITIHQENFFKHNNLIQRISLRGKKKQKITKSSTGSVKIAQDAETSSIQIDNANQTNITEEQRRWGRNRTKGHLPQPHILPSNSELTMSTFHESNIYMIPKTNGIAIRLENARISRINPDYNTCDKSLLTTTTTSSISSTVDVFESIDFSRSSCSMIKFKSSYKPTADIGSTAVENSCLTEQSSISYNLAQSTCRPLLRRILINLDISSLRYLKSCSLQRCTNLKTIRFPPCLKAFDVSYCTDLFSIAFPFGQREQCHAISLRGCRSLKASSDHRLFGKCTSHIMQYLRELDLSSTNQLPKQVIADALHQTQALESLSFRYVASNEALFALSESVSWKQSLRLVDVSFSSSLTDDSCETLIYMAPHLERLNLRACSNVSAEVYNNIPIILLEQQKRKQETQKDDNETKPYLTGTTLTKNSSAKSGSGAGRKGDNIFYFAS